MSFKGQVWLDPAARKLTGWIYDGARPTTPHEVDIHVDNVRVATLVADEPRHAPGYIPADTSYCGFTYLISDFFFEDNRMHVIDVSVTGRPEVVIPGTPALLEPWMVEEKHGPVFQLTELGKRIVRVEGRGSRISSPADQNAAMFTFPAEPFVAPTARLTQSRQDIGGVWLQNAYRPWLPYMIYMPDVIVDPGEGNVFLPDGRLWKGNNYFRNIVRIQEARSSILGDPSSIPVHDKEVAVFSESGSPNYYHWHVDCLPGLHQAARSLPREEVDIFGPQLNDWQASSVAALVGDRMIEREGLIRVPGAWVTSYNEGRSVRPDSGLIDMFHAVRDSYRDRASPSASRMLFVSRRDAATRVLENEEELYERLRPMGFEHVVLSDLDYPDKVVSFRDAEVVVSTHGAGLTNVGFAGRPLKVFEILPSDYLNNGIRVLCVRLGLEHHWYSTDMLDPFRVDVEDFMTFFERGMRG